MTEKKPIVKIKYVRKAGMWCRTTFKRETSGKVKQTQEWFIEKPNDEANKKT